MRRVNGKTFREIVSDTAPEAARLMFSKARLASNVAKAARDGRSRDLAYGVKVRLLEAALRVSPRLFRRFPDPHCGRWVFRMGNGDAMHGRVMEGGR